jgi:hypothetical protein
VGEREFYGACLPVSAATLIPLAPRTEAESLMRQWRGHAPIVPKPKPQALKPISSVGGTSALVIRCLAITLALVLPHTPT